MALAVLRQIRQALATLNPRDLRELADRPVKVGLIAPSADALGQMETYFAPHHFSAERRVQAAHILIRGGGKDCDIEIYDSSILGRRMRFRSIPRRPKTAFGAF